MASWSGKALALSMFAGIMTSNSASAFWQDGNKLYDQCRDQTHFGLGYMEGVVDSFAMDERRFCIPPNVSGRQLSDVICQDLRENPKDRAKPAALLIFMSLNRAWPCE